MKEPAILKPRSARLLAVSPLLFALAGCQSRCHCADREKTARAPAAHVTISRSAFDGSKEPFTPHEGYLSMSLPFEPLKPLLDELTQESGPLVSRGEAHVTVLTPPELTSLGKAVTLDELDRLAVKVKLQRARLEPICVGEGQAVIDGKSEKTYFVVVKAPELVEFRREVARLAELKAPAMRTAFAPEHFYPHVTVGFSKMDLHEQNGVIKDERSCRSSLELRD